MISTLKGGGMNKKTLVILSSALLILAGCESMGPKTTTGAAAGGIIGATAGGIIGYQSHNALAGAGIGAVAGAIGGGLIGNTMDKKDKEASAVKQYKQEVTSGQFPDDAHSFHLSQDEIKKLTA